MYRKTNSFLAPIEKTGTKEGHYDLFPAFRVQEPIYIGLQALADKISNQSTVIIEGAEGVLWDMFIHSLEKELIEMGKTVCLKPVSEALKSEEEVEELIKPFMGEDDSIFGRMSNLRVVDFFCRKKLAEIRPDSNCDINIVYGQGAALTGWEGCLIFVDLPKNELQFRMAAGVSFNFACTKKLDARDSYKRSYFVDWPMLDAYKGSLIPKIDWIVDEQRIDQYTFMSGQNFRNALSEMCRNSFRVRPWFAPGVWGGTYLRDSIEGLNKDEKNLAWSFELMALENGIMFQHDNVLMETSFSFLMSYGYKEILGDCAEDFKEDFPIRFDFLDTINGDNLSIQCHPRPEYIRSRFGKTYTQDETYYILRCTPDATVYLGFQEGIRKDEFSKALNWSQDNAEKLNITDYVQSFEAKKHDLFLIPNGTIHASGAGNLVLEISSAPYIFTFKMYDWVRLDIDGRPRPINIEHGLNNVRFERNGDVVKETLISKPYVMEKTDSLQIEHVPTHPDHFYDVHRYTLSSGTSIKIDNNDKCHVWMIVEGSHVELETAGGMKETYNYIETFIVPAATEHYSLTNTSDNDVMLVKAFVKDNYTL